MALSGALDRLIAETTGQIEVPEELPLPGGLAGVSVGGLSVRPNPTRGEAVVRLVVPEAGDVRVVVYDALGREVARLAEGHREPGALEVPVSLSGGRFAPGAYLVRAEAGGRVWVERLTLVR